MYEFDICQKDSLRQRGPEERGRKTGELHLKSITHQITFHRFCVNVWNLFVRAAYLAQLFFFCVLTKHVHLWHRALIFKQPAAKEGADDKSCAAAEGFSLLSLSGGAGSQLEEKTYLWGDAMFSLSTWQFAHALTHTDLWMWLISFSATSGPEFSSWLVVRTDILHTDYAEHRHHWDFKQVFFDRKSCQIHVKIWIRPVFNLPALLSSCQ